MPFSLRLTQQCNDLTQLLGTECLPYVRRYTGVYCAELGTGSSPNSLGCYEAYTNEAIRLGASSGREIVIPIDDHQSIFAIPLLDQQQEMWFAVGKLKGPNLEMAGKLVRLASEASRRMHQIEKQNETILKAELELDRSYSERAWLRQLGGQRAVRKRSSEQGSKQALETLKSLVHAEAVAIVACSDLEEEHGLESMITTRSVWTLEDVRLLLQLIRRPACGDSTIQNHCEVSLCNEVLHSCIVVPIGESDPLGYVVALNRNQPTLRHHSIQTEDTFTAGDAELLHEVAGYLSTDGHINVLIQESEQLVMGALRAMSSAIEARDPYTRGHSERVARVGYQIAVRLKLSEVSCQEIYLAGILHDIGKIGIPDHVLLKPGKLQPGEYATIQKHPEIGHRILEEMGKLKFALPGVLYHHERTDGKGYPHGLLGDQIPLMARILAVSDALDAMTSSRVYRNALDTQRAIEILKSGIGSQWDGDVVQACLDYIQQRNSMRQQMPVERTTSKTDDWRQVSKALRALQL